MYVTQPPLVDTCSTAVDFITYITTITQNSIGYMSIINLSYLLTLSLLHALVFLVVTTITVI